LRSKNNKRKSATRREGKLAFYVRRITVFSLIGVLAVSVVAGTYFLAQAFYVRDIRISGNNHLTKRDIEDSLNVRREPLLNLHLKDIEEKLKQNAWIKKASLRWQLPGTLIINIEEAVPGALLNFGGETFLVNEDGNVMDKLQNAVTPFLPVIRGIDPRYRKNMSEAMKLVGALAAKNIISDKQFVEIEMDSYGLNVNIDGEFIKVGYGQYSEKFEKWMELEPELKKRGIPVQYVDLRFKDSVIVKPLKPEKDADKGKDKDKDKKENSEKKEKKVS
jgi:cell division septal protein FtsQ